MDSSEETSARITLRIAGVFQEIRELWIRRLDTYFSQLESLVQGQWLTCNELSSIVHESRMAAREAFDGLAGDLTAELVHESNGLVARHEVERASLADEISSLRDRMARAPSGDGKLVRRQNEALVYALMRTPEFRLLEIIRAHRQATYDDLVQATGQKRSLIQKLCKALAEGGYIALDRKAKPHLVKYFTAPWAEGEAESEQSSSPSEVEPQIPAATTETDCLRPSS
jgi:predicted transcriptional regulator